jgi:hypothetical protein
MPAQLKYALGRIPSPKYDDAWGLGHPHHLKVAPIVTEASVITTCVNQLELGACVGNSVAVGLQTEMTRALALPFGQFVELPSRLYLYGLARGRIGTYGEDSGAMISDAFYGATKLGFPPESAWSYPAKGSSFEEQLAKCTADMDTMVYHRAADQKLVKGAYRLASTGQELADDIARAIALGQVVAWGTDLDMAFQLLEGTQVWPGVTGEIIGGHAMLLRAFKPDPLHPGQRLYGSLSSWDIDFADHGTAWVRQSAIVNAVHASEHWVIGLIDNYSEVLAANPPKIIQVAA